jgi:hypothetical protein
MAQKRRARTLESPGHGGRAPPEEAAMPITDRSTVATVPTPRPGALALGAAGLLFAAFPLLRPFFRMDVFAPDLVAIASPAIASSAWVLAHLLVMAGFVLLPFGLDALHARVAAARPRRWALAASWAGIALVLPALGVETFAVPVIGRTHLAGQPGLEPLLGPIYRGPMTLVMVVGLALLAAGAIALAAAARRTAGMPRGAASLLAAGLSLWLPLLPRPVRVVDGLLIGAGALALAFHLWREPQT